MADDNIFGEYQKQEPKTLQSNKLEDVIVKKIHPMYYVVELLAAKDYIIADPESMNDENKQPLLNHFQQYGVSIIKPTKNTRTTVTQKRLFHKDVMKTEKKYLHVANLFIGGKFTPRVTEGNYYNDIPAPSLTNWVMETYGWEDVEKELSEVLYGPAASYGAKLYIIRGNNASRQFWV